MCIPPPMLTALSVASTVGSGVAQVVAQSKAAKAQAQAQAQASADLAKQASHRHTEQARAQDEENISNAIESAEVQREGQEVIGTAITAAEESHTSGNNVAMAVNELRNEVLNHGVMTELSEKIRLAALGLGQQGAALNYVQDWRGLNPPIEGPDLLGIAMDTASSAIGSYQQGELFGAQRENFGRQNELYAAQRATSVAQTAASRASAGLASQRAVLARSQTVESRLRIQHARRTRRTTPSITP